MDPLKSCPFCGGEADLVARDGRYGTFVYVVCSICDAQSKRFRVPEEDEIFTGRAAEKAAHFWNQRIRE